MADVDIDPFGEHEWRPEEPTDEKIPLDLVTPGGPNFKNFRNKLKALASLLGQLGIKAAEALPGIIRGIINWILNRAKDVVGWVSQNIWALVVGIGGLIYTYVVTRK